MPIILVAFGIAGALLVGFLAFIGIKIVEAEQERYRLMTIWRNEHIAVAQLRCKREHECASLNRDRRDRHRSETSA
jgi:hypothetical protein